MTLLTATAVITAVDRASAVFGKVAASARAAAGTFGNVGRAADRAGTSMTTGLGAAAAFGGVFALAGEREIDRLLRLTQSAGELSDEHRNILKSSALAASLSTGLAATDIIKAQQALIQGGIDVDAAARMSGMMAMISRSNDISADKVAEDAINVANAFGFAMATTEDKIASMTRALEFMSTVPNLSTETWSGLRTSLKYAAPVAGALGIKIEELGAALSILADAGFKGEEGGTALRTILTRLVAPTRQARLELRAMGISVEDLYKMDSGRLGDMKSLAEALWGAGLGNGVDLDKVLAPFSDLSKFKDVYAFGDALQAALEQAFGIKPKDAEARGILQKAIQGHWTRAIEGYDLKKAFTAIKGMNLKGLKEYFGLQRLSQAKQLVKELSKVEIGEDGEAWNKFEALVKKFGARMPGSIERRFKPVSDGFAFEVDRMAASLAGLRTAIFSSGIGGDVTRLIGGFADSVSRLAMSDPERLKAIGYGIAGIAGIAAGAVGLGVVAGSLNSIAAVLSMPVLGKLLMAGGLAGLLGADFGSLFMGKSFDPFGNEIQQLLGYNAPILELMRAFSAFSTEVGGLVGSVAGLANEFAGLIGLNLEGSVLVNGLRAMSAVITAAADKLRQLREDMTALRNWQFTRVGPLATADDVNKSVEARGGSWWDTIKLFFDAYRQIGTGTTRSMGTVDDFGTPPTIDRLGAFVRQPVTVTGNADVKIDNTVTVKIDGPGTVTDNRPGSATASVPLSTGRGMSDAGSVP